MSSHAQEQGRTEVEADECGNEDHLIESVPELHARNQGRGRDGRGTGRTRRSAASARQPTGSGRCSTWSVTPSMGSKRVCVVALSDVGRSPRMLYHCLSLAEAGFAVDLVAQRGSRPLESVERHPNIRMHLLSPLTELRRLGPLRLPVKFLFLFIQLFWTLFSVARPSHYLVQTPPALPTLPVVRLVSWLRGARMIIDWHNLGYTLLALSVPAARRKSSLIVRIYKWVEKLSGRRADKHLCVTRSLKIWLKTEWGIEATVLHDRPPALYQPLAPSERAPVLRSLAGVQRGIAPALASVIDEVAKGQSRLVVSGTSWTPDEDFGVLLDAVAKLDNHALATPSFPPVTFIITGRGPLRDQYLAKAAQIGLRRMSIHSAWLSAEDYPRLLGAADLGVSLHSSSSGLDLPMKMLDMYGTGLPVCAHNFAWCAACFIRAKLILSVCSLDELLVPGQNGTAFTTSEELFTQLKVRLPPGCHQLIVNAGVA